MAQLRSSSNTSINSRLMPRFFKIAIEKKLINKNTVNFDYGSGKYNNVNEFLLENSIINLQYDPFNKDFNTNCNSIKYALQFGLDYITCNNVLNVIDNDNELINIVNDIYTLSSIKNSIVFFTIYEGDKSGIGKETQNSKSWQRNQKKDDYIKIIKSFFSNVEKKYNIIIAYNNT